jgi:phosphoenolpyruvate carboxylase
LKKDVPRLKIEPLLLHQIAIAWRVSIVREQAPSVKNEAEHIYSTLLNPETLTSLLAASREILPVYVRSWVGGDKDGHPGVDEIVMLESFSLSRLHLYRFVKAQLLLIQETLNWIKKTNQDSSQRIPFQKDLSAIAKQLQSLKKIQDKDGSKVQKFRKAISTFSECYVKQIGQIHPALKQIKDLLHIFPGLVVPLELRESSDILMQIPLPSGAALKSKSNPKSKNDFPIVKMLKKIALISQGGDPKWYVRGFIISMTESIEHIKKSEQIVTHSLGKCLIPVIPLFEQAEALEQSPAIVQRMIQDEDLKNNIHHLWNNNLEVMVGYSDSSKQSGVFPSRLAIAQAMNQLDQICREAHITPFFFQGSGGSVDRGGGTIHDQTAWWPRSALKNYKVTIQGEMVERSLANPEITRGQIERIYENITQALQSPARPPHMEILKEFATQISHSYREMIHSPEFLKIVEKTTPYAALSEVKIGSRPVRRASQLSVEGLRAIPWVMCWTQTRVLFPTWWGVGSAWKSYSTEKKVELKRAYAQEAVFSSFVKAFGFTLAKIELPVWKIYLDQSQLEPQLIERFYNLFSNEYQLAVEFLKSITGEPDLVWFRPWLDASVRLRSPMIHPLNLLQIISIQEKNYPLLRITVTGISSGMLTTG